MNQIATRNDLRLPYPPPKVFEEFKDMGLTEVTWRTIVNVLYPKAQTQASVVMLFAYCQQRKLDPFKRQAHIVPVWDNDKRQMVDTVWPGIAELRTTAHRTKQYAGKDTTKFGRTIKKTFKSEDSNRPDSVELKFPEWAQVTVYKFVNGERCAFEGEQIFWEETVARVGKSQLPNAMWQKRPKGQIAKCAEAAALRQAFPEELGSEYTVDEMEGQTINADFKPVENKPEPIKEYKLMGDDGEGVADARGKSDDRNEEQAGRGNATDGNETTSDVIDADWQDEEEGEFLENLTKETDHEMPNCRWEVLERHFERLKSIAENSSDDDNKQQAIELLDVYEQDKGSAK